LLNYHHIIPQTDGVEHRRNFGHQGKAMYSYKENRFTPGVIDLSAGFQIITTFCTKLEIVRAY